MSWLEDKVGMLSPVKYALMILGSKLDGEKEFEDLDLYAESRFLLGSNCRCM
jgi:hypothetical protein